MFGLSTSELLLVFGVVLLVFGPKKLPELGRALGRGIRSFKKGLNEVDEQDVSHPDSQITHDENADSIPRDQTKAPQKKDEHHS